MSYVNVGVEPPYNKSKKALREQVKEDSSKVIVYTTAVFGPQFSRRVSDLDDGDYAAVGPWPSRERKWYATIKVSRSSTGKRLVSVS